MEETIKEDIKEPKTMGRPRIEIDWEQFDKLCGLQCTLAEISSYFDCSEDTIERRVVETYCITFAERFAQKRGRGKIALRRKQYEGAMAGNVTLLIWLGKQYLGQVDKQESQHGLTTEAKKLIIDMA
jgi:hypothetical protein